MDAEAGRGGANAGGTNAHPAARRSLRFALAQGTLVADAWGPVGAPTVLLLHGGGQTRHAWGEAARRLGADGWQAVALDLPGHGDSDWVPDGDYSTAALARMVADVLAGLPRPAALVGASLGGLASIAALGRAEPPAVAALVLVDVAPRVELAGVQRIVDFMTAHPEGFASLEEAARHVARYRGREAVEPARLDGLRKNLRRNAAGRWMWHWDPMLLHERNHAGRTDPEALERALAGWRGPTLLVRGALSDVVSLDGARALLERVPGARFVDLAEAGHMVAGDANDAFSETIIDFLHEAMPPRPGGAQPA